MHIHRIAKVQKHLCPHYLIREKSPGLSFCLSLCTMKHIQTEWLYGSETISWSEGVVIINHLPPAPD